LTANTNRRRSMATTMTSRTTRRSWRMREAAQEAVFLEREERQRI
jgi:hypothetical protein